jgi:hypothetical protein
MSDTNPNENKTSSNNIGDELNELGNNLRQALKSAWESEERRKLQKEIEDGLANLGESLSKAAEDFSSGPTGQSIKEDVKDMHERWQTGEMRSKMHSDILEALRKVNNELRKATGKPPEDNPGA